MDNATGKTACGKGRNRKDVIVSGLILAIYTFLFDWLVQGKLFMSYYTETASLWRSPEQMQANFPFCILFHLVVAYLVAKGFFAWRKRVVLAEGQCANQKAMGWGLWLGMLLGACWAAAYIYMPIPGKLAVMWFISSLVKWTLGGFILGKLYACHAKKIEQKTGGV